MVTVLNIFENKDFLTLSVKLYVQNIPLKLLLTNHLPGDGLISPLTRFSFHGAAKNFPQWVSCRLCRTCGKTSQF